MEHRIRYDINKLEYWICYIVDIVWTVDWDMIMKVNNTTYLWHCWMCGTVEWDETVKLDNITEFVTLLNMWECWKRYECEII